jgi:hypothetical protein
MTDGTKYKGGFVNGMEEGNGIQRIKTVIVTKASSSKAKNTVLLLKR